MISILPVLRVSAMILASIKTPAMPYELRRAKGWKANIKDVHKVQAIEFPAWISGAIPPSGSHMYAPIFIYAL